MKVKPLDLIVLFIILVLASLAGAWVKASFIDRVAFEPNWQFILIVSAAITAASVFFPSSEHAGEVRRKRTGTPRSRTKDK